MNRLADLVEHPLELFTDLSRGRGMDLRGFSIMPGVTDSMREQVRHLFAISEGDLDREAKQREIEVITGQIGGELLSLIEGGDVRLPDGEMKHRLILGMQDRTELISGQPNPYGSELHLILWADDYESVAHGHPGGHSSNLDGAMHYRAIVGDLSFQEFELVDAERMLIQGVEDVYVPTGSSRTHFAQVDVPEGHHSIHSVNVHVDPAKGFAASLHLYAGFTGLGRAGYEIINT